MQRNKFPLILYLHRFPLPTIGPHFKNKKRFVYVRIRGFSKKKINWDSGILAYKTSFFGTMDMEMGIFDQRVNPPDRFHSQK